MKLAGEQLAWNAMQIERDRLRKEGRCVVFTNGCFDILHSGHVQYLTFARSQGDVLVVGLNSDQSVRINKGTRRPIVPQDERAKMLCALRCVDYVVLFDEETPVKLIENIVPDVLIKGADWAHYVAGREVVEAAGGKVVLAEMLEGHSTTNIIERILGVFK